MIPHASQPIIIGLVSGQSFYRNAGGKYLNKVFKTYGVLALTFGSPRTEFLENPQNT